MTEPAPKDNVQLILDGIALWEPRIALLAAWGIKGFHAIRTVMADARADDEVIAAMEPKWNALIARFHLLSGN